MEIILSVCLISEPGRCMDHRLPELVETSNPMQCNAVSMLHAAQWAGEHPGWRIIKWRCDRPGGRDM